ncbi:MAG: L-asparaginase 1, partial [Lachnospiraceae bacterium]
RAKKVRSKSFNAFDSIDYPFLAIIQGEQIIRYIPTLAYTEPVKFYPKMNDKVCLMKLIPGVQAVGLQQTFEYYDAIIVESFGVGGIPASISKEFYRLHGLHPETLIIMATQVAHEGSDMTVYEVGQKIKQDCNFLESYDMTLEAVIAKTMWITGNPEEVSCKSEDIFYKPINYDLVFGKNRKAN